MVFGAIAWAQNGPKPTSQLPEKTGRAATKEEAARKQRALDLIVRSHALDQQVSDEERQTLLPTQITVVSRLDSALAKQWANEMFDLGTSLGGAKATFAQAMAIGSLASKQPQDALELLKKLDTSAVSDRSSQFAGIDALSGTILNTFRQFARKEGKPGMPVLLSVAATLGEKGRYPYSAVMFAARDTKDEELIEATARQLYARFEERMDAPTSGYDFAMMLSGNESVWPKELLKPALDLALEGILRYPITDANKTLEMTMRTPNGSVTAKGPVELGLVHIAPMVKRVDPELWEKTVKKYASIEAAASLWKDSSDVSGLSQTFRFNTPGTQPSADDQQEEALMQLRGLVWQDPDKAEQAMASLSDPKMRADAYSFAAQAWASSDPARAARAAAEAQKSVVEIKDPRVLLGPACAKLQADAATGNQVVLAEDLDKAFQLANKVLALMREDDKSSPMEVVEPLSNAANAAMKVEPELTLAHIETLSFPLDRAQLYAAAASALSAEPAAKKIAIPISAVEAK